jgi:predicted transcriptional regulator
MEGLLEILDCQSDSAQRLQALHSLTDGPKRFSELRSELESPRPTLKRNLSILEERDWVSEERAGYVVTTTGSLLLRELQLPGGRVERIHALEPFLAAIDDSRRRDATPARAQCVAGQPREGVN